jgi:hypothetical protein
MSEVTSTRVGINSIPLEVRLMIWNLLLVPYEHIEICYSTDLSPIPDSRGNPQAQAIMSQILAPTILRVSRNIHREAEEVLYSLNIFEFKESSAIDDLILFLQSTSDRVYRSLIRQIIIRWPYATAKELESPIDFLVGCQGLKRLTMTNLPLRHGRIPKCIETWMSGLRVNAIELPNISLEVSSSLTQLIEGKGIERKNGQKKRADEERALKVICFLDTQDVYLLIYLDFSMGGV